MKMDYSVTREIGPKIFDKASTEEIKAGLERIKKAQEQVLLQLKKNHPDYSIDIRQTNEQLAHQRQAESQMLKHQLNIERERSVEKSTLYRRRVVDLESSLALHEKNEGKLRTDNKLLEDQLAMLQRKYRQLQEDYQKLMFESEKSNKNLRALQKQIMQLNKKLQDQDVKNIRAEFEILTTERNQLKLEKMNLIKNLSQLETQNLQIKTAAKNNLNDKKGGYRYQDISRILKQINRINLSHDFIFSSLKENKKLTKDQIQNENNYQNSLNAILQMLGSMQKIQNPNDDIPSYKFDHQQSFRDEVKKIQAQLLKKHKKQILKVTIEKEDLVNKQISYEKQIEQIRSQNKQFQSKLDQLRKQKSQYIQEITQLNSQLANIKANKENEQKQKMQEQFKRQKNKDHEYRAIILQLNEQMLTIQKQKKDLDGLLSLMTNNKSQQQSKNKKKLTEIAQVNQKIRQQNQKIQQKYQGILIEKQHLYLSLTQCQTRINNMGKQLARQVMLKEKLIGEVNKLKQQKQLNLVQIKKYQILSENNKKQTQKVGNSYILEIQKVMQQNLILRHEIENLIKDRNQLRDVKAKYGLLLKDNQILGKKAKFTNSQIDHLWTIKEVQYQNVNRVLGQLKPL